MQGARWHQGTSTHKPAPARASRLQRAPVCTRTRMYQHRRTSMLAPADKQQHAPAPARTSMRQHKEQMVRLCCPALFAVRSGSAVLRVWDATPCRAPSRTLQGAGTHALCAPALPRPGRPPEQLEAVPSISSAASRTYSSGE